MSSSQSHKQLVPKSYRFKADDEKLTIKSNDELITKSPLADDEITASWWRSQLLIKIYWANDEVTRNKKLVTKVQRTNDNITVSWWRSYNKLTYDWRKHKELIHEIAWNWYSDSFDSSKHWQKNNIAQHKTDKCLSSPSHFSSFFTV